MVQAPLPPITDVIPHRHPFLFLDRCLSCTDFEMVGEHHFEPNRPFFSGHFPGRPIVPGVILIEGLAQSLAYLALRRSGGETVLLASVDACRFRKPVYPDQIVRYHVTIEKMRTNWVFAKGEVTQDGKPVLSAQLKGFITDPQSQERV